MKEPSTISRPLPFPPSSPFHAVAAPHLTQLTSLSFSSTLPQLDLMPKISSIRFRSE